MFKTIRNAWSIPDLRKKLLFTLLIIIVFRIGSVIPVGLTNLIYGYVLTFIQERFTILTDLLSFLPSETVFATLTPLSLGIGAGIGFLGSFYTVRKHLRV